MTGGASKNDDVPQIAADVFQSPIERLAVSNSATGHDLPALQQVFCEAAPCSSLQPDPALASAYQDNLIRFEELLGSVRQ